MWRLLGPGASGLAPRIKTSLAIATGPDQTGFAALTAESAAEQAIDPLRHLGFYEFFAGGGMARQGLSGQFQVLFANDFDTGKAAVYRANFGSLDLVCADVFSLAPSDLPGGAALAWASSPCQDFSLAGRREGLAGSKSSAFFGFWRLMEALGAARRAPGVIVVENVTGLLSSHAGQDLVALCRALRSQGYFVGALEVDAELFLPQSRPRLFVIAAKRQPDRLCMEGPHLPYHSTRLQRAVAGFPPDLQRDWVWWRMPAPPKRNISLADLLLADTEVDWHPPDATTRLLGLLAPPHQRKLAEARSAPGRQVGTLFRRTRPGAEGSEQRAEVRFDGVAGCLRTPGGGSSRQFLVSVEGGEVRTRDLSPRETARLMGLGDDYILPKGKLAALHLTGDGVAVPVARWMSEHLLSPLAQACLRPATE